jgi:integrase
VDKILDAIDRGNPCGKRDYAIILLIARLGLRSIDVKRLIFADFQRGAVCQHPCVGQ